MSRIALKSLQGKGPHLALGWKHVVFIKLQHKLGLSRLSGPQVPLVLPEFSQRAFKVRVVQDCSQVTEENGPYLALRKILHWCFSDMAGGFCISRSEGDLSEPSRVASGKSGLLSNWEGNLGIPQSHCEGLLAPVWLRRESGFLSSCDSRNLRVPIEFQHGVGLSSCCEAWDLISSVWVFF